MKVFYISSAKTFLGIEFFLRSSVYYIGGARIDIRHFKEVSDWDDLSEIEQRKEAFNWIKNVLFSKGIDYSQLDKTDRDKIESMTGHALSKVKVRRKKKNPFEFKQIFNSKEGKEIGSLALFESQRYAIKKLIKEFTEKKKIKSVKERKNEKVIDDEIVKELKEELSEAEGGHQGKHGISELVQASIIYKPDEIWYGINDNRRRVIFFIKEINHNLYWVITDGFEPKEVITAYRNVSPTAVAKVRHSNNKNTAVWYKKFKK
ncbi:MAG: hypothetical protein F6K39_41205 [Okeania sp. SIO3B3]|nr:hypothetical protein [Okeania sp. SIO3B3]